MNKQLKNVLWVGVMILLFTACGPVEMVSTPQTGITQSPAATPTVLATALVPEKYSQYVGVNYPPVPEGFSEDFAMLIQDAEDYGLFLFTNSEGKMLWLSKMTHRDGDGNAYWEVKDILDLSNLEPGLTLFPDGCSLNGLPDSEIFVVGKDGVMILAWRANTTLNVFEVIPLDGIKCHSDKAMNL